MAGAGNDIFSGGYGNDTFVYAARDGDLAINNYNDSGAFADDTLNFTDLSPDALTFMRHNDDLAIAISGTGRTIDVAGQFDRSGMDGVEQIRFADGTIWTRPDIDRHAQTRADDPVAPPSPDSPDQTISGDDQVATMSGRLTVTVTGNRDTVTASGAGGTIHFGGIKEAASISDGSVDFWNGVDGVVIGDRNVVTLNSDDSVVVSGVENAATIQGTGARLSIDNASVNVFNGASGSVTGDGDALTIYAGTTVATTTWRRCTTRGRA